MICALLLVVLVVLLLATGEQRAAPCKPSGPVYPHAISYGICICIYVLSNEAKAKAIDKS
jgi:hypothetical protein